MENVKRTISYILAFIVGLLIILAVALAFISNNILNETNMQIEFKNTNYYYNIFSIIENTAKDYVMQSGFHEMVLNDVITENKVQNDLDNVINNLYNNKKIDLNTDEIREKLHKNIKKQIEVKKYDVDNEMQAGINEFEDSIINEYKANMYYSEDIANLISKYLQKISQMVIITIIVLSILIIILCVILFKLNKPAIGISFIISGAFFIIIKIYSGVNLAINNVLILNWAFSRTMSYILNNLIQQMFIAGIVLTLVGSLTILFYEYKKNKKKIRNSDGE